MIDLRLEKVSKRYTIRQEETHHNGLWRKIRSRFSKGTDFWALRGVDLSVERGETLGIIGHNGSGKSTILKLLSRITAPTEGRIRINGRVAALLEVASGFHPELTGRENIFLSGSIIGMRRREIHASLDQIIDFAEIRPFIDIPVKRYSSGMFVRLGFSIAAHLHPDILLLDEVLAVGDMSFQRKCMDHIEQLKRGGMTMIFISHDLAAVERLCDLAVLLERGRIIEKGAPAALASQYLTRIEHIDEAPSDIRKLASFRGLRFEDESGKTSLQFKTGRPLRVWVEYESAAPVPSARIRLLFHGIDGALRCEFSAGGDDEPLSLPQGPGAVEFTTEEIGLQPGIYHIAARLERTDGSELDVKNRWAAIHVAPGKMVHGWFYAPHAWRLDLSAFRETREQLSNSGPR